MRLLHVVENLDRGAVENWLVRSFVRISQDWPMTEWTFYCILGKEGCLDRIVREHGGHIIYSPVELSDTYKFLVAFRATLNSGSFDVLHCHHDFLSGLYLLAATGIPFKKKFVHVHNTDEDLPTPSRLKRRLLLEPLRQICLRMGNGIIGISHHTLSQFLRGYAPRKNRDQVLYYGVNLLPIRSAIINREQFTSELDIPSDAKIILFAGRIAPLKNPCYVVKVLHDLLPMQPDVYALFAGTGELTSEIQHVAEHYHIDDRIRMLGWRDDIAYLMKNSDLFISPRLEHPKEGLGLVVVESQACGLPMLTSQGVTREAIVDPDLVTILPLNAGSKIWAKKACEILTQQHPSHDKCLAIIEKSHSQFDHNVKNLMEIYK